MSKRKGLSLEEKRDRMIQLLQERKEVFNLKELEKIAPVAKGITFKSVKEVVQSLVDDNLIETDKIGSSIYYWSFPSKALTDKQKKMGELKEKFEDAVKRTAEMKQKIEQLKVGREDTEERRQKALELAKLDRENAELSKYIEENKHLDPDVLSEMIKQSEKAKEAANRWTDNIHNIVSWAKKNMPNYDENTFNDQFGIPNDLEYVD